VSNTTKNVLIGLSILIASGVATWLFLPIATAPPLETPLKPSSTMVQFGPIQFDLMLLVVFVALGAPFAAIGMALLVRFLSSLVPPNAAAISAAASAPARKPAAPAQPVTSPVEEDTSRRDRLVWLGLIVVALVVVAFLALQFLPPGFMLF
jgi:hypothetical protein